jgi:hypothetical protein
VHLIGFYYKNIRGITMHGPLNVKLAVDNLDLKAGGSKLL